MPATSRQSSSPHSTNLSRSSHSLPSISTDQVRAFIELARTGAIRLAAKTLHLSEEGLRSRLLTLEERVGASLYEKERGRRGEVRLTHAGQIFLGKAVQFVEEARKLTCLFDPVQSPHEVRIAASQYLTYYLLIDVVRAFHAQFPDIGVRVFTRTEQQILASIQGDAGFALGICAPIEYPADLVYHHWFSMNWYFVARRDHLLLRQPSVRLADLADQPLILFEPGSTGRQHVLEAFYSQGVSPRIAMEATSTQIIVRMVEAGLGVAVVPLLPSGVVTRHLDVGQIPLGDQIRPIESGILSGPAWQHDRAVQRFISFVQAFQP